MNKEHCEHWLKLCNYWLDEAIKAEARGDKKHAKDCFRIAKNLEKLMNFFKYNERGIMLYAKEPLKINEFD